MQCTIEGSDLVIRVPMQKPSLSKSGKSKIVYSSQGNKKTETIIDGKPLTIGLNAYISAE